MSENNSITKPNDFKGFSPESTGFLKKLQVNNNKVWFESHRGDYEKYILFPFKELVQSLASTMLQIDPNFEIRPAVNKTISRIFRDTRFSKNKAPFKSTMWITFKRSGKGWEDFPAFYFELSTESFGYGMGFFCAKPATMKKFRERIDAKPEEFSKIMALYEKQKEFSVKGDEYKRLFDPGKADHVQEWYQKKNIYFAAAKDINNIIYSKKILTTLIAGFEFLEPLYHYLWEIKKG